MLEPTLPIWMLQTMCPPQWQLGRCRALCWASESLEFQKKTLLEPAWD